MRKTTFVALAALVLVLGATSVGIFAWLSRPAWSAAEQATLRSLALTSLPPQPADPGNAVADDPRAAALGHRLFFDSRFSGNGAVACSTCHEPERFFTDGRPLGVGVGVVPRHAMSLIGASRFDWFTWDGKADSQWAQALLPLEHPAEHGGDRLQFAHLVAAHYRAEYEALFGPLPDLADEARFPPHGAPGIDAELQAAWDGMAPADQDAVNRVFANIGKVLAAYQRLLQPGPARFDRYVAALETGASAPDARLSSDELAGLRLFIGKAHCINCHNGPLLANGEFHNTAIPGVPGFPLDRGRATGIARLLGDPFNCLGPYSDAAPEQCSQLRFLVTEGQTLEGGFKTPTLRNVAATAPYMHMGQFATLGEVLAHYNDGGQALIGHNELAPLGLTERELAQIEAFLGTLTAPPAADPRWLAPPADSAE